MDRVNFWPNFWYKEPWDKFDLGVLPGKKWREMWQSSTWFKSALQNMGYQVVGLHKVLGENLKITKMAA